MSAKQPYEIERKWLMDGWPAGLAETGRARMRLSLDGSAGGGGFLTERRR